MGELDLPMRERYFTPEENKRNAFFMCTIHIFGLQYAPGNFENLHSISHL